MATMGFDVSMIFCLGPGVDGHIPLQMVDVHWHLKGYLSAQSRCTLSNTRPHIILSLSLLRTSC